MNQIIQIKKVLIGLAAYYDRKLTDDQVQMYAEDLQDMPLEMLAAAVKQYRNNPRNNDFPRPARLRQEVAPQDTPEDSARVSEAEIWEAVASCGQYQSDRARHRLGGLAWEGVSRFGGWLRVCEAANEHGSTFRAQMRNTLESIYRRAQAGQLQNVVQLPEPKFNRSTGLTHIGATFAALEKKEDEKS